MLDSSTVGKGVSNLFEGEMLEKVLPNEKTLDNDLRGKYRVNVSHSFSVSGDIFCNLFLFYKIFSIEQWTTTRSAEAHGWGRSTEALYFSLPPHPP